MSIYLREHILARIYSERFFGSARTQPDFPRISLTSSGLEHMLNSIFGIHNRVFAEQMLEYILSTRFWTLHVLKHVLMSHAASCTLAVLTAFLRAFS